MMNLPRSDPKTGFEAGTESFERSEEMSFEGRDQMNPDLGDRLAGLLTNSQTANHFEVALAVVEP